jgi:hypothetical protein
VHSTVGWNPDIGLFSGEEGEWFEIHYYLIDSKMSDPLISCLQLVEKTLNILGFKCTTHLVGPAPSDRRVQKLKQGLEMGGQQFEIQTESQLAPSAQLLVEDNLEREWVVCSFSFEGHKGFSAKGSVARLYALLLEKFEGIIVSSSEHAKQHRTV